MKLHQPLFLLIVSAIITTDSLANAAKEKPLSHLVEQHATQLNSPNTQRFLKLARQTPHRMDTLLIRYKETWRRVFLWDAFLTLDDFELALQRDRQQVHSFDSNVYAHLPLPDYKQAGYSLDFEATWSQLEKTLAAEAKPYTVQFPRMKWVFSEKRYVTPLTRFRVIETQIMNANGKAALFETRYDPKTKTVVFFRSYLRQASKWIPHIRVLPGKGIPTSVYMHLYQMKVLGVEYGQAHNLTISKVNNLAWLARLDWLKRQYPDQDLHSLYEHIDNYLTTILTLSGHQRSSTYRLQNSSRSLIKTIEDQESNFAGEASLHESKLQQLLQRYVLTRDSSISMAFDAYATLAPIRK